MSLLENLKTLAWRQSSWDKLFQGDTLFTELRALSPGDLEPTIGRLEQYQRSLPNRLSPERWQTVRSVLNCARIAQIDEHNAGDLGGILLQLDEKCGVKPAELADVRWYDRPKCSRQLRSIFEQLTWEPPLCAAWALDTVTCFWKGKRAGSQRQSITILLIDEKSEGFTAELILELMEDGWAALYSDPETMSLVTMHDSFLASLKDASEVMHRWGLWPAERDIRWRIVRQDDRALKTLVGGSAGAALALGMAKLLAVTVQEQ